MKNCEEKKIERSHQDVLDDVVKVELLSSCAET